MSTSLIIVYCVISLASIVYGYLALRDGYIVMRMPDGERVRYDKETQARGFYVSVGLFLSAPFFVALLGYLAKLNVS